MTGIPAILNDRSKVFYSGKTPLKLVVIEIEDLFRKVENAIELHKNVQLLRQKQNPFVFFNAWSAHSFSGAPLARVWEIHSLTGLLCSAGRISTTFPSATAL